MKSFIFKGISIPGVKWGSGLYSLYKTVPTAQIKMPPGGEKAFPWRLGIGIFRELLPIRSSRRLGVLSIVYWATEKNGSTDKQKILLLSRVVKREIASLRSP
jgi:hypothetical protein